MPDSPDLALHLHSKEAPASWSDRLYQLIASIGEEQSITNGKNTSVTLRLAIPIHLVQFVLAMEDKRFWVHPGIDPIGIGRAIIMFFLGRGRRQGASTIPEQVLKLRAGNMHIKNLPERIMRAVSSIRLNFYESKVDILSEYFRHVYLGGSCYGIESASRNYFKCSPSNLTPAQSFFISDRIGSPNVFRTARLKNILNRTFIRKLLGYEIIKLPLIYGTFYGHNAEGKVRSIIRQTSDVRDEE